MKFDHGFIGDDDFASHPAVREEISISFLVDKVKLMGVEDGVACFERTAIHLVMRLAPADDQIALAIGELVDKIFRKFFLVHAHYLSFINSLN